MKQRAIVEITPIELTIPRQSYKINRLSQSRPMLFLSLALPTLLIVFLLVVQSSTNMTDVDLEMMGANASSIELKTDAVKCKVCLTGDVLPELSENKTAQSFMIYTRDGTVTANHVAYR